MNANLLNQSINQSIDKSINFLLNHNKLPAFWLSLLSKPSLQSWYKASWICHLRLPPCPVSNISPYPLPTSWHTQTLPPFWPSNQRHTSYVLSFVERLRSVNSSWMLPLSAVLISINDASCFFRLMRLHGILVTPRKQGANLSPNSFCSAQKQQQQQQQN